MSEELKHKLYRQMMALDRWNITHAKIHPRTLTELTLLCGFEIPKPGKPPLGPAVFAGVPLLEDESTPEGELQPVQEPKQLEADDGKR